MSAALRQIWIAPEIALDARERSLQLRYRRERWLLIAVLQRAIGDLFRLFEDVAPEDYDDARAWFFSHSREAFSFRWLCEQLSLNPSGIRRHLCKWMRAGAPLYLRLQPLHYLASMPALAGMEDFHIVPEWLQEHA